VGVVFGASNWTWLSVLKVSNRFGRVAQREEPRRDVGGNWRRNDAYRVSAKTEMPAGNPYFRRLTV
jgi:hypothetical protein